MKLLFAALIVFPASWVAVPRTPPMGLIVTAAPEENYGGCAWVGRGAEGGRAWATAKQVRGVRAAADLDRIGPGDFVVVEAQLRGQRLAGHRLSGLCFEGGDLAQTDWRGVTAESMGFAYSDLSGAAMTGAVLRRTSFRDTSLDRVDASGADFSGSRIAGGSFDGLSLRGAKLQGFEFSCGLINGDRNCEWPEKRGVDARGADLTGAAFDVYLTNDWRFDGAVLDRTTVQFYQLDSFRTAAVRGPVLLDSSGGAGGMKGRPVRLDAPEWRQLLAALWTDRPSFDCARAATAVERSICAPDGALDARDRRLGDLFRAQLAEGKTTRDEQRRWLRTRDACAAKPEGWDRIGCISEAYDDRLDALMRRGAVARWIRPGAHKLFLSSDVAPPAAFQRTALYRRIFPVLLGTASSRIAVRVRDRRRIEAGGDAYGSNGHMCSIEGLSLAFDKRSGWFGAPRSAQYRSFYPTAAATEALLRFAGDEAIVGPQEGTARAGEYVMCGARASFDSVTAVRVPPAHSAVVSELERDLLDTNI